jgi:hypothetical protein
MDSNKISMLVKKHGYRIEIEDHVLGYRVSLYPKFEYACLITRVEATLDEALTSCIQGIPDALDFRKKESIEKAEKTINALKSQLNKANRQYKELKGV